LRGEAKAEHVGLLERRSGFQGVEGDAVFAHGLLHVGPGAVAALGLDARLEVGDVVKDLQAHVGAADLVDVGEGQHQAQVDLGLGLDDLVQLTAGVPRGFGDPRQYTVELVLRDLHVFGFYRAPDVPSAWAAAAGAGCAAWKGAVSKTVRTSTIFSPSTRYQSAI